MRKLITLISSIMLFFFASTAIAAIPGDVSEGKYIKTFVRGTQNVPAYRDSSLQTRGNSRGAYNAAVYPTDEIRIYQMNGSVAYIGYIAGKNWVKAYIATSAITPNNSSVDGQRFSSGIGRGNVFARPNGTVYSGSAIDAGDTVWKLAEENGYTQVVYPAGNLYKMAWIRTSDYNSRVSNGGRVVPNPAPNPVVQPVSRPAADTYVSPAEGDYYLLPEANSGFAMDVKNGGAAPIQTIIHLWNKNDTDAQIFHIKRVNGDWHIIQHKRTGYVVNVQWGNNASGTGVWLYHNDGTASCYWRFIKQDNGSYIIQSQLPGNPILELQNNSVFAGGRIQLWQRHSTQAGRWKLVPANAISQPVVQEQNGYVRTSGSRLLFRSGPSTSSSILARLNNQTAVTVLSHNNPNGWSKIRYNGREGYVASQYLAIGNLPVNEGWQWPVDNKIITNRFGDKVEFMAKKGRPYHVGLDMVNQASRNGDNPPIYAAASGVVVYRGGPSKGNGNRIVIRVTLNGQEIYTSYSHLNSFTGCPSVGQMVSKGQQIGTMGATGNVTGKHLHFAVYDKLKNDPWGYLSTYSTTKVYYDGTTYYNPEFVLNNGRLP